MLGLRKIQGHPCLPSHGGVHLPQRKVPVGRQLSSRLCSGSTMKSRSHGCVVPAVKRMIYLSKPGFWRYIVLGLGT